MFSPLPWVLRPGLGTRLLSRSVLRSPVAVLSCSPRCRGKATSFEEVTRNIGQQEFQVVDVRPLQRFLGQEPEPREGVQPGHIPLSKCMPFFGFLDHEGMFLPTGQLKQFFEKSQVDLKKPLCGTCGSGVTACHMVLAAHLCGAPGASVYDGSWYEWFSKAPPEHVISQVKSQL